MRFRGRRCGKSLLLGIGLSTFGWGCTALLGSFDVDPNAAAFNPEGGTDGGGPGTVEGGLNPDGNNPDAPFSGDANDLLLNCGVNNIKPLEEITDPTLEFDRFLRVSRGGNTNGLVRIVARLRPTNGTSDTPIGLRTYGFEPQGGINLTIGKFEAAAGQVIDVRRQAGQLTALALQQDANGNGRMLVFNMPDGDLQKISDTTISRDFNLTQTRRPAGALGVYPTTVDEYFYAVTVSGVGASATSQIVSGHKTNTNTPAPSPASQGPQDTNMNVKELVRTQAGVFVFNERAPEPGRPRDSTGYFVVPDTGIVPNPPLAFNPIVPNAQKGYVISAATGTATGGLKLAVGEVDFSGQGAPLIVRAGEVAGTALTTQPLDASKLPVVFKFGSLLEAPISGSETRLVNDELIWIGSPPDPQQGQGLNFAWIDLKANAPRAKELGAKRLIPNRNNIIAASVGFSGAPTGISGDFDLVWIESQPGRKSLFYGELRCVK